LLIAFCALFSARASAQAAAHFAGAMQSLFATGISSPTYTAVDASGNVYISDSDHSRVLKETLQSDGSYVQSVVGDSNSPGLSTPEGLAVDKNGNVYIADIGTGFVKRMVPQSNGSYAAYGVITTTSLTAPYGIALDANGSLYISDALLDVVLKETPNANFTQYTETSVATASNATGMLEPIGIAVDASGDVYIADAEASSLFIMVPQSNGSYLEDTYYDSTFGLSNPNGVAVDASGKVFVANFGANNVLEFNGPVSVVADVILNSPMGVAVDANDNLYIADTSNNRIVKDSLTGWNFGTVAIGATSPVASILFDFDAGGTVYVNVGMQNDLTSYKEFVTTGTGSCNANGNVLTYSAGQTCTVDVTFAPAYSGTRDGSASLNLNGNATIAAGYLQGTGSGPQISFLPGFQSASSGGLNEPIGVTADVAGYIYVADYQGSQVWKFAMGEAPNSGTLIGTGLSGPTGIAIDGNGDVYITDGSNNRVLKETPYGRVAGYTQSVVPTTGLGFPQAIAVDGSGNLYIVDNSNSQVLKETLTAGNYTQSTIATGLANPQGIAVDASGIVYIAEWGNNDIVKLTPSASGYTQTSILDTLTRPAGITVDGHGNLYISLPQQNEVVKETATQGGYTQSSVSTNGLNQPYGVAADIFGNLYIADFKNARVVVEDFFDTPTLTFASTEIGATSTDSPQTVTVTNIGNAQLSVSAVSYPADFPEGGSVATDCTSSTVLNANQSCTLTVDFSPTAALNGNPSIALNNEDVILSDNSLNHAGSMHKIYVMGTETQGLQTINFTDTLPATATYAANLTYQISATGGASGNPVTFSVSGPATLSISNLLTITGAGTVTVTANQAGNGSYSAATAATQSIQISAATQTINFTDTLPATATYAANLTYQISATGGASGNPVTFSVSGPATLSVSNLLTITGAGTVTVTANQAASSGFSAATAATQSIQISAATQTINFTDSLPATAIYSTGQVYTLSATGGASGNPVTFSLAASSTPGAATLIGNVLNITGVGTITITANQAGNGGYSAAPAITQSIQISAASQTIHFTDSLPATATYAANLTYQISATGGASDNPVTFSVSGPATLGVSNLLTITGAGTVTITANQAANSNYAAGTATQSIAIGKATVLVGAISSANPVFTQNAITLSASFNSGPTGTVTFNDGSAAISAGCTNVPVTGNLASCVVDSASAPLASGLHNITAVYSGDANYAASSSAGISETVIDFTIAAQDAAITVTPGKVGTYSITVTPVGGTTFPAAINLNLTGLPANYTYSFSPSAAIASGAGATTVTLTIQTELPAQAAAQTNADGHRTSGFVPFALALLFLPFAGRLRKSGKRLGRLLTVLLLLGAGAVAMTGMSGCANNGFFASVPQSYTVDVTATSGTLMHSSNLTLNVQ
jgi:sugar lactone lactonase YvrE